ncbi:MAG: hypothetical protein AAFY60_18890, partial [Myxococcota bacterium]
DALEFAHAAHDSGSDKGWSGRVLGMIYRDLGELETAQHHFDDAYVFERAQEPVVETRVAELSDHRVILAAHQGDMEAARDALSESDRLRRGYLGEDWDGMVWHRHWTGLLAIATGDGKSAAGLLDRMLTDYVRFIGETSHLLAFARSDRGWTALIQGDIEYARELFSLARTRLESMQEGPHPRLAEVLLGQSLIALTDGEQGIARQLSERALMIRRVALSDSPGAKTWRANACRVHRWAGGECTEALEAYPNGLDRARVNHAVRALCFSWSQGCPIREN